MEFGKYDCENTRSFLFFPLFLLPWRVMNTYCVFPVRNSPKASVILIDSIPPPVVIEVDHRSD